MCQNTDTIKFMTQRHTWCFHTWTILLCFESVGTLGNRDVFCLPWWGFSSALMSQPHVCRLCFASWDSVMTTVTTAKECVAGQVGAVRRWNVSSTFGQMRRPLTKAERFIKSWVNERKRGATSTLLKSVSSILTSDFFYRLLPGSTH